MPANWKKVRFKQIPYKDIKDTMSEQHPENSSENSLAHERMAELQNADIQKVQ